MKNTGKKGAAKPTSAAPAFVIPRGLGVDAPTVIEGGGGVHSDVDYRFDLLDPMAMFRIAKIMDLGSKKGYEDDNWKKLPSDIHLNHAMGHIMGHIMGDTQGDHLAHAAVRLIMAMGANSDTPDNSSELKVAHGTPAQIKRANAAKIKRAVAAQSKAASTDPKHSPKPKP